MLFGICTKHQLSNLSLSVCAAIAHANMFARFGARRPAYCHTYPKAPQQHRPPMSLNRAQAPAPTHQHPTSTQPTSTLPAPNPPKPVLVLPSHLPSQLVPALLPTHPACAAVPPATQLGSHVFTAPLHPPTYHPPGTTNQPSTHPYTNPPDLYHPFPPAHPPSLRPSSSSSSFTLGRCELA